MVLAVFPLPFISSAIVMLAESASGLKPTLFSQPLPGNSGGSALLLTLTTLTQLAPALLVWHLLGRGGESLRDIGLDRRQPGRDALLGVLLTVAAFIVIWITSAMIVGVPGSYGAVLGHRLSPIYLLPGLTRAVWAAVVEETVVAGYLLHRLGQLGLSPGRALAISTVVRASYHLYYGVGVLTMIPFGLLLGWVWQRYRRLAPLIAAHAIYDGLTIGLGMVFSG